MFNDRRVRKIHTDTAIDHPPEHPEGAYSSTNTGGYDIGIRSGSAYSLYPVLRTLLNGFILSYIQM
ncbi:MAG: hypothetical protein CMI13_09675 [Oleibacter sp.]|nr:hypothetical protein [Thalassolituus sp.]